MENLLKQKGLKSLNIAFFKIIEQASLTGIELSDDDWSKIQDHMSKFIRSGRKE
jgi:hypothetical protein